MEFLQKLISAIINALNEFFELFNDKKVKGKKKNIPQPPPSKEGGFQQSPPVQEEKPPVNIPIPVEMKLESDEPPVYKRNKSILTYRERFLHSAIRKAIANEYVILMKVRMGDFVYVSNEPKDKKTHVNQVICKHVDFLLCGRLRLEPLLVIELDDSSHKLPDHLERDRIKNEILDSVGMPYLRVELQQKYDSNELRRKIKERILKETPLFENE